MAGQRESLARERAKLLAQRRSQVANARVKVTALRNQRGEFRPEGEQALPVWLDSAEACDYLRYTGKHRLRTLYKFIARNGLKVGRRSARKLLIRREDLDAVVMDGGK